jgi:hypothetical protein
MDVWLEEFLPSLFPDDSLKISCENRKSRQARRVIYSLLLAMSSYRVMWCEGPNSQAKHALVFPACEDPRHRFAKNKFPSGLNMAQIDLVLPFYSLANYVSTADFRDFPGRCLLVD